MKHTRGTVDPDLFPPVPNPSEIRFAATTLGTWSVVPGSVSNTVTTSVAPDTENGTKTELCVEFGTTVDGNLARVQCELTTPLFLSDHVIGIEIYIAPQTGSGFGVIQATAWASTDAAADTYNNFVQGVHNVQCGRWNKIMFAGMADSELPAGERSGITISNNGVNLNNTFKRFRIDLSTIGGYQPRGWIRYITFGGTSKTILLNFNDDYYDDFSQNILPLHEKYQIPVTAAYITSASIGIGTSGKASLSQIKEDQARYGRLLGLAPHSVDHLSSITGLTQTQLYDQVRPCMDYGYDNGFNDEYNSLLDYIAPLGLVGIQNQRATYQAALVQAGCRSSRGTIKQLCGPGLISPWILPCKFLQNDDATARPWVMGRWMEQARGQIVPIGGHKSGAASDSITYTLSWYEQVLAKQRRMVDAKQAIAVNLGQLMAMPIFVR